MKKTTSVLCQRDISIKKLIGIFVFPLFLSLYSKINIDYFLSCSNNDCVGIIKNSEAPKKVGH